MSAVARGWHRPISRAQLLGVSLALLLLWLAGIGAAAWAFWQHWEARLLLRDQPLTLQLPEGLLARAEVAAPVTSPLNVHARIPIKLDQVLDVQLQDSLAAQVQLHAMLPVDTVLAVSQHVMVHTEVSLPFHFSGWLRWLPTFQVKAPVSFTLPLVMAVPIKAQIPMDLDMLVRGQWPAHLAVPLRAEIMIQPHVRGALSVKLLQQVDFKLLAPVQPVDVVVRQLDLGLPLRALGWCWAEPDALRPWW